MIHYPYRYSYQKSELQNVTSTGNVTAPTPTKPKPLLRLLPSILITFGSIMIANVLWPLLNYQVFISPSWQKTEFISPIPKDQLTSKPSSSFISPLAQEAPVIPQVMGDSIDYTDPITWFPAAAYDAQNQKPTSFSLSIPKVDIKDALVYVGGHDLEKGLIQYPGTAEPGQYGSPVIFGHSVLRQFYNPSPQNPQRYLSIFSKIMLLKEHDRIFLNYDQKLYTYEVVGLYEVEPTDLEVLKQRLDVKELRLITCVPEGTYLRRGVVEARLVNVSGINTTTVIQETGL